LNLLIVELGRLARNRKARVLRPVNRAEEDAGENVAPRIDFGLSLIFVHGIIRKLN
jgi:hypothetical protein